MMKTAMIKYIGGEDADGQLYSGLSMGAPVIHARLVATALTIPGVDDATVEISTDAGVTWHEGNVPILRQSVAQVDADSITVVES